VRTLNWQNVGNVLNWTINFALQPATAYWWQVRAVNASGQALADGGQWWYFTTANSPAPAPPGSFGKSWAGQRREAGCRLRPTASS
jgi:hypothetical protein